MLRNLFIMIILFILCIEISCRKEELKPELTLQTVAEGTDLKAVYFTGPSDGYVSGGKFEQEGYIYKTEDGGSSWQMVYSSDWSINAVKFLNSSEGYACGDSLHIIKTTDEGATWSQVELSWYPYPEYIVPLKHIEFADDTTWYFTGGLNYQFGVNVRTQNGGFWWDMEVFQVELNSSYFRDANNGLIAGYGIVYITHDANTTFEPSGFEGDNITSLSSIDPMQIFACGYNGGIFQSADGGVSWSSVLKPNGYMGSRIHFNGIKSIKKTGLVVGNQGVAYYTSNAGGSWDRLNLGMNNDFYDVEYMDGQYLLCGEDGIFLKIQF